MGKNKLAKFIELESFGNVIQVSYKDVISGEFGMKGRWGAAFFNNDNPIVLELGCGKGEYTVGLGRLLPGRNFIGVDIKGARMWKGAKEASESQMRNVGFLRTNIELLGSLFGSNEVSEIWITFPDPQMKKCKKRLTSSYFMKLYREFLAPGGLIHLKTDSNFLYRYTMAMIAENNFDVLAKSCDIYSSTVGDTSLDIKTFYERQWLERGKKIKYVRFMLNGGSIVEPEVEIEHDDYRSFGRNRRGAIE